jgi:hypothetical protein
MKKLTRREADFESLIEAAILLEGRCERAAHGCKCRGCDECEENYQTMSGDEEENLTLDELINRELGPEKGDRYEYEGEDPYYEYDEENENIDRIAKTITAVTNLPTERELKQKRGGVLGIGGDPVVDKLIQVRRRAVGELDKLMGDLSKPTTP